MKTQESEFSPAIVHRTTVQSLRPVPLREDYSGLLSRTALIDKRGIVVAVDAHWPDLGRKTGAPLHCIEPGTNYLLACRQGNQLGTSRKAVLGIQAVLKREKTSFAIDYACQTASALCLFRMSATRFTYADACVAITHTEVTDLHFSNTKRLRQFAQRLIHAQEQERQRISQDIHDDFGSHIALIGFTLREAMKTDQKHFNLTVKKLDKVLASIIDLSAGLRNLSHGLYPPSLRYAGIGAAMKTLSAMFEQTHQLKVQVMIPRELPRFSSEVELCIFRISQECLHNIAAHSGAHEARIVLAYDHGFIRLAVSDSGRGFNVTDVAERGGLGLLSMEERAISVGGHLTVNSSARNGTEVCLNVPIE